MGLNLRGTPLASQHAHERTKRAFDILQEIQEEAARMGLPPYPKPSSAPKALSDIDVGELSNRELETQMAKYVGYASYLMPKLAEAEAAYKIATANLKSIKASLKVSLFKDGIPKNEIEARVIESPEYAEQDLELLKLFATKEILDAHYKAYSKQAQALSRFVELRKLEFEQSLREHNVGNIKKRQASGIPGGFRR